jgi:Flp pilus assembly protein protease CpaA
MTISAVAATAAMFIFSFTMVYACISDLTSNKIHNGLVLMFLLAYAVLAPLAGFTAYEIAWSVAVAARVLWSLSSSLHWDGSVAEMPSSQQL